MTIDTRDVGLAPPSSEGPGLERRITQVGLDLAQSLGQVVDAVPGGPYGPQKLAQTLGLDKVLTSRLLKAVRSGDPMAVAFVIPGPEPLRRLLKAAKRRGVDPEAIAPAWEAVERFESLIRHEAGDRSALDTIISAWLPEARRDFELRRKQSAFKAMSQLKGVMAQTTIATVLLGPSADGKHIDVVWIMGFLGLQRLRPEVMVKLVTRRMTDQEAERPRQPVNLAGDPIRSVEDTRLDSFCVGTPAQLDVHRVGNVVQYTLGGDDFGPRSAADLILVEANFQEMPRYVPRKLGRKGNVFAEVTTPSRTLLFDVFVHDEIYPRSEPQLLIYDTVFDGVVDVNDRSRDLDRLNMLESIRPLGRGVAKARDARVPRYVEMLRHVFTRIEWDESAFAGHRCAVDYPVHGSQVAMTFDPPEPPV